MLPIKSENHPAMKEYLTFCVMFHNAIDESDTLRKMDRTEDIMKLVGKLPYRMRERWRLKAYRIKETKQELAKFQDYVDFVREQVKISTDSVYTETSVSTLRMEDPDQTGSFLRASAQLCKGGDQAPKIRNASIVMETTCWRSAETWVRKYTTRS